jgi:hypothetical protein
MLKRPVSAPAVDNVMVIRQGIFYLYIFNYFIIFIYAGPPHDTHDADGVAVKLVPFLVNSL